jgi:hypothetical protein
MKMMLGLSFPALVVPGGLSKETVINQAPKKGRTRMVLGKKPEWIRCLDIDMGLCFT